MNYYNPYFYSIPTLTTQKAGLLTRLFGNSGITIGKILNGTQHALNFANQAIPLVKQIRPMLGNAKTMFKVMNEFKKTEVYKSKNISVANNKNNEIQSNLKEENITNIKTENFTDGPTFFI